jgi:hypothetical protein
MQGEGRVNVGCRDRGDAICQQMKPSMPDSLFRVIGESLHLYVSVRTLRGEEKVRASSHLIKEETCARLVY